MGKCTTLDSKLFGKEQGIVFQGMHSGHILIRVRLYRQNLDPRLNTAICHVNRLDDSWPNSPRPLWFLTEEALRRLWVRSLSETGILPVQSPCTGPLGGFSWTVQLLDKKTRQKTDTETETETRRWSDLFVCSSSYLLWLITKGFGTFPGIHSLGFTTN